VSGGKTFVVVEARVLSACLDANHQRRSTERKCPSLVLVAIILVKSITFLD